MNPLHLAPLALAACLLFAACGDSAQDAPTEVVSVADSAGIPIVTNDLTAATSRCEVADTPSLVIGDRVGDPMHELYRVFGAARLADGRIAIVNQGSNELRFYSPEGDFLNAAGGEGEGPGEFLNAFVLRHMPGDTLWVADYRPWHYEVISPEGEWVRGVTPTPRLGNPPRESGVLPSGEMILAAADVTRRDPNFAPERLSLLLHAPTGEFLDTLRTVEGIRYGLTSDEPGAPWVYPWFDGAPEMTAVGEYFALGHGNEPEIRLYTVQADTLALHRIVRWTGTDRTITDQDVATAVRETEEQYADLDAALRDRLVAPLISDRRPVAERMPTMVGIYPGPDGSMNVKEYPRPGSGPMAQWIRFDAQGRLACRFELPGDLSVYQIGDGWVLAMERTELDVEVVGLWDMITTEAGAVETGGSDE